MPLETNEIRGKQKPHATKGKPNHGQPRTTCNQWPTTTRGNLELEATNDKQKLEAIRDKQEQEQKAN